MTHAAPCHPTHPTCPCRQTCLCRCRPQAHLAADHAAACGVCKVVVVVVADEGRGVALGELVELGGVLQAGAVRRQLREATRVGGVREGEGKGREALLTDDGALAGARGTSQAVLRRADRHTRTSGAEMPYCCLNQARSLSSAATRSRPVFWNSLSVNRKGSGAGRREGQASRVAFKYMQQGGCPAAMQAAAPHAACGRRCWYRPGLGPEHLVSRTPAPLHTHAQGGGLLTFGVLRLAEDVLKGLIHSPALGEEAHIALVRRLPLWGGRQRRGATGQERCR
jgi:hypothetical protein